MKTSRKLFTQDSAIAALGPYFIRLRDKTAISAARSSASFGRSVRKGGSFLLLLFFSCRLHGWKQLTFLPGSLPGSVGSGSD